MPKVGKQDPHMKSPWGKYIIIAIIVALICIYVAPRVIDIYNDNLENVDEKAANS